MSTGLKVRRAIEAITAALGDRQQPSGEIDPALILNHPNPDLTFRVRRSAAPRPVEMPAPREAFDGSPDTLAGRPVALPGASSDGAGLNVRRPSKSWLPPADEFNEPATAMQAQAPPDGLRVRRPPTDPVVNKMDALAGDASQYAEAQRAARSAASPAASAPPSPVASSAAPAPAAVSNAETDAPPLEETQLRELLEQQRRLSTNRATNQGGGVMANLGVIARRLAPAMQDISPDAGAAEFFARLGGAAAPAVANAIRPGLAVDERDAQQDERARVDGQVTQAIGRTKVLGDLEDRAASRDLKRAQAEKARRVTEKFIYKKQNGVLVRIGATSGIATPVTDAEGRVLDAEERTPTLKPVYDEAGKVTYYTRWNPKTDTLDEVQTGDGERAVIAPKLNPLVDVTAGQQLAHDDRVAARAEAAERFERTFGLGVDRFRQSVERDLRGNAARTFGVQVRGKFERTAAIAREIAELERRKAEMRIRPSEADPRIDALRAEANSIADEIQKARSSAISSMTTGGSSGGLRVRRPVAGAVKFTEAEVRQRARAAGRNEDAAVKTARARKLIKE